MRLPRLMIAGTGSGVGKTSVACAIISGMIHMGYTVQPFKAGPDYIDPSHLAEAAGRPAYNLDVWMMGKSGVTESFVRNSTSDISIIEGVMGFYDGFGGVDDMASTHQIANITSTPTILVVDVSGMARSVAAIVSGFIKFAKNSTICGVILNRIGSAKHLRICKEALESTGVTVMGAIPKNAENMLQSRHLGLVPAAESDSVRRNIDASARFILEHIDMDAIIRTAGEAPSLRDARPVPQVASCTTICVALDGSFNFYYKDNLDRLRSAGARLEFFSPETASVLPECNGLYVGGGFPEVRAELLAHNKTLQRHINDAIQDGMPTYAECGGLMYLSRYIRHNDQRFEMVGAYESEAIMTGKMTLNYTRGDIMSGPLAGAVRRFRGHEFHYSHLEHIPTDTKFAQKLDIGVGISDGRDGMVIHNSMASYGHLYFNKKMAVRMVEECMAYSTR